MISDVTRDRINELKKQLTKCPDYAREALKFDAMADFERRVLMQAAGVRTTFFGPTGQMEPIKRFEQLKPRDQSRVAKVFPLVAALGAKVAA